MAFATVRYEVAAGGVATIALDQPETRNALSDALLDDLLAALARARDDERVRCVVLTSTHERVFSGGADLAGFAAPQAVLERHRATERIPRLFTLLGELGKPTLCAANGHVLAGALGLALACDLVVARADARFGTPEVHVGVFPFMVCALLRREVSRKKMAELVLLGEQVSALEAERIGLVNRVVEPEAFDEVVADWAGRLAARSPLVVRLGKEAMARQQDMAFADALEFLHAQLSLALTSDDAREGMQAFLERRAPTWTGR